MEEEHKWADACPIQSTHDKYIEAYYFLLKCLEYYHEPQKFRFNLNAFIQALRNITFMLQSEENRPDPFTTWYQTKQEEMKADILLKRFVEARNTVVKRKMLESSSEALAGIFRGRKLKFNIGGAMPIDPFTPSEQALQSFVAHGLGLFFDEEHSSIGEQLGVKRTWIVLEIGDEEIVSLCCKAMNYMGELVAEAHELYNVGFEPYKMNFDMDRVQVLLETDIDPSLPEKWGWV